MSRSASPGAFTLADPELAFSGTIPPTRLAPTYRLGLVVVALTMLLLPVLYVGLIAATGAVVWWHVTQNTWLLHGSGGQWRLLIYATPAVVGFVLVFFMVKPILARPSTRRDPLPLDAQTEPLLFAFIDEICRQVRAPHPRQVYVDCAVNASAGFPRGRLSLLRRDLVLTIGLPLVAGLSIRELGGVLAHEFGHFAQGGGMRLTTIVRGVNAWFARVVYERDEWDVSLERWSKESDWRLAAVLVVARGAVWLSRRVLTGLMLGGHAISCFMMRQMEYDADSYEIKVAGSDAFIRTSMRMRELNAAAHFAYGDVREGLGAGTLPANLADVHGGALPPSPGRTADEYSKRQSREDRRLRYPSERCGSHPRGGSRCRRRRAGRRQRWRDAVVSPLRRVERRRHETPLRARFGLRLEALTLVDTDDALRDSRNREENLIAFQRFFGGRCSVYRPLLLPVRELEPLSTAELRVQWTAARDAMSVTGAGLTERYAKFNTLEEARVKAFAAQELLAAGFTAVNAEDFGLPEGNAAAASSNVKRAIEQQRAHSPALEAFETAAVRRLACGLLLQREAVGEASRQAHEAATMVEALNTLARIMPDVHELHRLANALALVEQNAPSSPVPEQTAARGRRLDRMIAGHRETIRGALTGVACPSGFAASPMTLAERCGLPPDGPLASAPEVINRAVRLYFAILGQLTSVALQADAS